MALSDGRMTTRPTSPGARVGFWVVSAFGIPSACFVWYWYGLAMFEAQSEQPKALAAGTSEAGFGEVVGGVPLVLAHLAGLVTLLVLGWFGRRWNGIVLALVSVAVTSLIGIAVAQLLWDGQLFLLGIDNDTYIP